MATNQEREAINHISNALMFLLTAKDLLPRNEVWAQLVSEIGALDAIRHKLIDKEETTCAN